MAKAWFESEFGKSKTVKPPTSNTPTNSFAGDSTLGDYYFDETFQITPLWTQSEISTYMAVKPIVIVPIQPIPFLDRLGHQYALVFFRDSLNQVSSRLQVYEETPEYKLAHPILDVANFTGFMYQIALDGRVQRVFSIVDGQFRYRAILRPNPNLGRNVASTRGLCSDCREFYDPTRNALERFWCFLCDLGQGDRGGDSHPTTGFTFEFGPALDLMGTTNGGGTGSGGSYLNVSWQLGNTLFSAIQFNQMRTLFYANGLEDLFETLKSTNSPDLALANNFIKSNNAATIASLKRFITEGGTFAEFKELYKTSSRFSQINAFFSNERFSEENKLAVKGFNALMDYDDDFVISNQNRGSKTIKQLVDDSGFPKISAGFLIGLARENGVGDADNMTKSFTRLGRIMEDFVLRSLGISKNTKDFPHPTNSNISAVEPDGLGEGNVARYEVDQNGIRRLKSWSSENSIFLDSKFTARREKVIKDNVSTNANGTVREQLSTMIDVLAQKKGVAINNVNFPNVKASDHGIASLYIITLFDVGLDPNLIQKAYDNNVNVYKRWVTYNVNTKQFEVSGGFEDLTPTTITPPKGITTRKSPGYTDPLLTTQAVYPNWNIQ
jgi:hypothetical protein